MANELCEQQGAGKTPDLTQAAKVIPESGEFDLDQPGICEVYDEIASTVGGFKEISTADTGHVTPIKATS